MIFSGLDYKKFLRVAEGYDGSIVSLKVFILVLQARYCC